MKRFDDILHDIATFTPKDGTWLPLDALLAELFVGARSNPEDLARALPTLFGVFERYPRHDGFGVMWTLLHGLESVPGYEAELVASLRRCPTYFALLMLERMVRAGITRTGDVDLAALLEVTGPLVAELD